MTDFEGLYQVEGDSLRKGGISLAICHRTPTLIKPPLYIMQRVSTGFKYVSSLWEYSEGGYVLNDRHFTYTMTTKGNGVAVERMYTSN